MQHCGGDLHKQIASWTRPAIIGILIGSAAMNAFAFAAQTKNLWMTSALPQNPRRTQARIVAPAPKTVLESGRPVTMEEILRSYGHIKEHATC